MCSKFIPVVACKEKKEGSAVLLVYKNIVMDGDPKWAPQQGSHLIMVQSGHTTNTTLAV